jgi:hypothetical protein
MAKFLKVKEKNNIIGYKEKCHTWLGGNFDYDELI